MSIFDDIKHAGESAIHAGRDAADDVNGLLHDAFLGLIQA